MGLDVELCLRLPGGSVVPKSASVDEAFGQQIQISKFIHPMFTSSLYHCRVRNEYVVKRDSIPSNRLQSHPQGWLNCGSGRTTVRVADGRLFSRLIPLSILGGAHKR